MEKSLWFDGMGKNDGVSLWSKVLLPFGDKDDDFGFTSLLLGVHDALTEENSRPLFSLCAELFSACV